jgi:hypothetical protein
MKSLFRCFAYVFLSLLFVCFNSCNILDKEPEPLPEIIIIGADEIVMPESAGQQEIMFTTNRPWSVAATEISAIKWLTVSPTSGQEGNITLVITTRANNTYDNRSIGIIITADTVDKVISVVQKQKDALILSPNIREVTNEGGTIDLELKTNLDYEVIIPGKSKEWISQIQSRALETYNLQFTIAAYDKPEEREGLVVIKDRNSILADTLFVIQTGVFYKSGDYSQDGNVITLQSASRGKGIDLVFMGDGFTDKDIASGKYNDYMHRAMEHFFSIEPIKSHRDYFNVYSITIVSPNNVYEYNGTETALDVKFGESTHIEGNHTKCVEYASNAPVQDINKTLVTVIINHNVWAGTTYWWTDGSAIAYIPTYEEEAGFASLIHHESVGHGFGKLADEYINDEERIPANIRLQHQRYSNNYGWYANVDFTDSPDRVKWSRFLNHPQYNYVDLFEGGFLYGKGVWRPEAVSCMDDNRPYFNAPSRYELVRRMKELAGEPYSWEEFVAQDNVVPLSATKLVPEEKKERLAPPVVMVRAEFPLK